MNENTPDKNTQQQNTIELVRPLQAGLPVPDGLLKGEFLSIARGLSKSGKLCGLGLMAFDASRDVGGNQARKLVGLVAEAFGE